MPLFSGFIWIPDLPDSTLFKIPPCLKFLLINASCEPILLFGSLFDASCGQTLIILKPCVSGVPI